MSDAIELSPEELALLRSALSAPITERNPSDSNTDVADADEAAPAPLPAQPVQSTPVSIVPAPSRPVNAELCAVALSFSLVSMVRRRRRRRT